MPCYDGGWPTTLYPHEELDTLRKRNGLLGSMLCAICRKFEEGADFAVADIPNLVEWWESHKKYDALISEYERHEKFGVPMTKEQRDALHEHRKYAV